MFRIAGLTIYPLIHKRIKVRPRLPNIQKLMNHFQFSDSIFPVSDNFSDNNVDLYITKTFLLRCGYKKIDCRWVLIANDFGDCVVYNIAAIWFSTALRINAFIEIPDCFANAATRECISGVNLTFKAPEYDL